MNRMMLGKFMRSPTTRLTAVYLIIIMALSAGFSFVLYYTCMHELRHLLTVGSGSASGVTSVTGQLVQPIIDQAGRALREKLLLLNLLALFGGALLSYYFTRRTLLPIERALEAQTRFVADASHELRTPLTVILTSNEVSLRKPNLDLATARTAINTNIEEITKLKDLTDGLLSLATRGGSPTDMTSVSLQDVASEAMNRVLWSAQAKQIRIEDTTNKVFVQGNMRELVQAVVVLLDNAIKYSSDRSTIYLSGYRKNRHGYIEVRDQGSGIDADDLPHIFERFYRADASRAKSVTLGYGIGLSIAQKIAEQHHGKILASSEPNKGSIFTIEIPMAGGAVSRRTSIVQAPRRQHPSRVVTPP